MGATDATITPQPKQRGLPGNPGTLNVILHGVFIFEVKDDITVYIPNIGADHVYRAGTWLAEGNLEMGDFTLEGTVKNDSGKPPVKRPFDPAKNIVLKGVHVSDPSCCNRVYATLHLPLPISVRSMSILSVPADGIGGDSKDKVVTGSGRYSATVQILTYDFSSDSDLRLGRHPWEPIFDEGFVNLHILSEPDRSEEEEHTRYAFQMSLGLFTGINLSLRKPMGDADLVREISGDELPPGVHELEVQSLVMRMQWMQVLGRAIKEHRDLNGFWKDPTAFDGLGSCSGGGCGGGDDGDDD